MNNIPYYADQERLTPQFATIEAALSSQTVTLETDGNLKSQNVISKEKDLLKSQSATSSLTDRKEPVTYRYRSDNSEGAK